MVVNGSCEQDWPAVLELARRHPVQGELKILAFARGFLTPLPLPRAWRRFAAP